METLRSIADIVISTDLCDQEDVLVRAVSHLDLFPQGTFNRSVDVLVGAQYGSEGILEEIFRRPA
jgi:adenylosuccinate synthase